MENLRSRTVQALFWNLGGTGGRLVSQLAVQICLARLLSPKDFGLMAMLMVLTSIGVVFIEGGFGIALIHNKDATREEESSVFYCNLALSLACFLIFWVIAPLVATFYGHETLESLFRFSAFGLVLGAFGVVQNSVLTRELNFKKLSLINLLSTVLAGAIAIILAWNGHGVWSLAWQFVLTSAFRTLLLWVMSSWRPLLTFHYSAVRKMGAYGSRLVASSLISTLFENLNQLLIGKFYSAADLGFYSRAATMQAIPVNTFSQAVSGVLLPAFVHLNDKPEEFRRGYRRAIRCSIAVTAPMMALLALLGKPLFLLLLSEKWLPAVPYFQVLCLAGIIYPLHLLNINTLLALGKPELYLRIEVIKRIVGITAAAIALPFGVMAFAIATVAVSIICLVINTHYTKKLLNYNLCNQIKDITPFIASVFIAIPCGLAVISLLSQNPFVQIIGGGLTVAPIYLILSWLSARDTYEFLLRIVRRN